MYEAEKRNFLKTRFRIRSIQAAIPSAKLKDNGVMEFPGKIYSCCYMIDDVDFSSTSEEQQEDFYQNYEDILNALDTQATYKITLFNRNINYITDNIYYLPENVNDGYDSLRSECNRMRKKNRARAKGIIQEKYITVTIYKKTYELAEQYFDRFEREFGKKMKTKLSSGIRRIGTNDRIRLFHDFYRAGNEPFFGFDYKRAEKRKTTYKDYIAPDFLHFHDHDFDIGRKFGRVFFIRDWGTALKVETLSNLMELKANMMITIDIVPMTSVESRKLIENAEGNAEGNISSYSKQGGASKRAGYSVLPISLNRDRQNVKMFADDVNNRNMKVFMASVSGAVLADSMEELNSYTETIFESAAEGGVAQIMPMSFRQDLGLNTVLPYGPRWVLNLRDVTTENAAAMMPFNYIMYNHKTGIPYGTHADNFQEIMIDRRLLVNGNEWVVAVSGGGKSLRVKITALFEVLMTNGDVIFVDPHGEFASLTKALGGQVIHLGGNTSNIINIMDIPVGYEEGDDVGSKAEFINEIFSTLLGPREYISVYRSLVLRAARIVYAEHKKDYYNTMPPTLNDLYNTIQQQPEPEAQRLALLIEPFLTGYLKCFNGYTNVDLYSRVICFDLSNFNESLFSTGMKVVIDMIKGKLVYNSNLNKPTYIKIDEVARFLSEKWMAQEFSKFYREVRKFNGYITGIIQNVHTLYNNEYAIDMISNSEIVVMLRQSDNDAQLLQEMFSLSKIQYEQLIKAEEGCGIIKCGNSIFGYNGQIEKRGAIYDMVTTKREYQMYGEE